MSNPFRDNSSGYYAEPALADDPHAFDESLCVPDEDPEEFGQEEPEEKQE